MAKNYGLQIKSARFDQTSSLPDNINAGNKFYGADLAAYIKDKLSLNNYTIIDEDWGWLVSGTSNELVVHYGISDWHDIDNQFGGKPDSTKKTEANWYIVISTYSKARILGLFPYNKEVDCPAIIGDKLAQIMKDDGDTIIESGLELIAPNQSLHQSP